MNYLWRFSFNPSFLEISSSSGYHLTFYTAIKRHGEHDNRTVHSRIVQYKCDLTAQLTVIYLSESKGREVPKLGGKKIHKMSNALIT